LFLFIFPLFSFLCFLSLWFPLASVNSFFFPFRHFVFHTCCQSVVLCFPQFSPVLRCWLRFRSPLLFSFRHSLSLLPCSTFHFRGFFSFSFSSRLWLLPSMPFKRFRWPGLTRSLPFIKFLTWINVRNSNLI
jgi:hypothetical protein